VRVDVVHEEKYWYPHDGGIVWVAGFHLVDGEGRFLGRDAPELAERELIVTAVAGAGRHHADALQSAQPGDPLSLRRDAGNPHDANAIAIDHGSQQVGWVPREIAAELAPEINAGRPWSAVVLREQRASPRDPRTGLTMLLARAVAVELHEVPRRRGAL
jgi:hypothetical protein